MIEFVIGDAGAVKDALGEVRRGSAAEGIDPRPLRIEGSRDRGIEGSRDRGIEGSRDRRIEGSKDRRRVRRNCDSGRRF